MAGFLGFGDFTKEGKGVDKNAPQKRSLFLFVELFFRKFFRLVGLNLLYIITSVPAIVIVFLLSGFLSSAVVNYFSPEIANIFNIAVESAAGNEEFLKLSVYLDIIIRFIVTILFTVLWGLGPSTAGFTYVLRNYAREEHSWLISDFFANIKKNFKQSIVVFIFDLVIFFVLCNAYIFYASQNGFLGIMRYFIITMGIVYTMLHFYLYQLMITFELPLKQLYRNSVILSLAKLPRNILILFFIIVCTLGLPFACIYSPYFSILILIFVVLLILMLLSFCGFMVNFFIYPVIKNEMLSKVDPEKYGER